MVFLLKIIVSSEAKLQHVQEQETLLMFSWLLHELILSRRTVRNRPKERDIFVVCTHGHVEAID